MSRIKSANTKPELAVRRYLHSKGYRFRIHRKDLPGTPDLVLSKLKLCIFVHGCFWHRHLGCRYATTPKTRQVFWNDKFRKNVTRDISNIQSLQELGWKVLIIWECELKEGQNALDKILAKLAELSIDGNSKEGR